MFPAGNMAMMGMTPPPPPAQNGFGSMQPGATRAGWKSCEARSFDVQGLAVADFECQHTFRLFW